MINTYNTVVFDAPSWADDYLTFSDLGVVEAGTILARDAATSKLVPFVPGGDQKPIAVLTYDVVAEAAGEVSVRVATSGQVRTESLKTGDGSAITPAIKDQLRDYSIVAVDVKELNV